jgi:hypothetical protein
VPRLELKFEPFDTIERNDLLGGRTQPGATFHCAHGDFKALLKVIDWKPFDYMTIEQDLGFVKFTQSRMLTPTETGTRLQFTQTRPEEPGAEEMRKQWIEGAAPMEKSFRKAIADEVASGNITLA